MNDGAGVCGGSEVNDCAGVCGGSAAQCMIVLEFVVAAQSNE